LVVPGILIWATPPIFMYGLIAMLVWSGLRFLPLSARAAASALAVAALALIPPALINGATERAVQAWISGDVALKGAVLSGDTL
jgi:hypothetical protein